MSANGREHQHRPGDDPPYPPDLRQRLTRWATAHPALRPAVDGVLDADWHRDEDFFRECVVLVDDDLASIDWSAVLGFLDAAEHRGRPRGPSADEQDRLRRLREAYAHVQGTLGHAQALDRSPPHRDPAPDRSAPDPDPDPGPG